MVSLVLKREAVKARGHLTHKYCNAICITNSRVLDKSRQKRSNEVENLKKTAGEWKA